MSLFFFSVRVNTATWSPDTAFQIYALTGARTQFVFACALIDPPRA